MDELSATSSEGLRVYIAYEDFLGSEQLSKMLSSLNKLYNCLLVAYYPDLSSPPPLEAQLRIKESRTGESIILELIEGVMQVWNLADPTLKITGVAGITAAMSRIIIGFAKGYAEFRKTWYEGSKLKQEVQKAKYEADKLKSEIESSEKERPPSETDRDLSQIPSTERQQATEAAFEFFSLIEYSPNITNVQINGIEILNKKSHSSEPRSQ